MTQQPPLPRARSARTDGPCGPTRRLLFASAHSIVDPSNGAAVASLDLLCGLSTRGFECQAFCTSRLDFHEDVPLERIVADSGEPHQVRPAAGASGPAQLLYTRRHQVPVTIVRLDSTRHVGYRPEEVGSVLGLFRTYLDVYRPDVMLTYGGDPVSQGMIALARRRGIPVVFAIHNFAYTGPEPFRGVDYCIAPSEFACRYYRQRLGLDCRPLSNPVDWDRVRVGGSDPRFVTFVNPMPEKGVYPFVRIAHELGRRRPDIPLLVVESRGTRAQLAACGLGRDAAVNVRIMPNTTDPRQFWGLTRIVLMPSLGWESQGLVAVEALINGIPVIGSDRGGIPETLGGAGIVLPLPDRLTPESRVVPTAEEVGPWVEAIIRLWDDRAWYAEQSDRARSESLRWHPDRLRPLHAEFFRDVRHRPGPPFLPGRPAWRVDPTAVTAALWRAVPDAAHRVLEVRWDDRGATDAPHPAAACRFERTPDPGRDDPASAPWRQIDAEPFDLAADVLTRVGNVDAVLLDQVLESADELGTWLRRLRRLLAPAGVLVAAAGAEDFSTLTGRLPGGDRAGDPPRRSVSAEALARALRDSGFKPEIVGVVAAAHAPGATAPGQPAERSRALDGGVAHGRDPWVARVGARRAEPPETSPHLGASPAAPARPQPPSMRNASVRRSSLGSGTDASVLAFSHFIVCARQVAEAAGLATGEEGAAGSPAAETPRSVDGTDSLEGPYP